MPGYTYIAVDKQGTEKKGSMEAESREKVIEILKRDGLLPVSVKERGFWTREIHFSLGQKIKPRDLSVFCRQFVSIMQAGVPMKEALQMLQEQTENKLLQAGIGNVLLSVEKGNTLADSMRAQREVFPAMLVDMVAAGESAGNLEMSFSRMAIQFEKEARLKAVVRKATIYPLILVIAAIGVTAVMLLYVIPVFIDMFADLDVEMPAFTMAIMNASRWLGKYWYIVVLLGVGIAVAYRMVCQTQKGRHYIDKIKLKLPLFGKLSVKTACAQMARTMSTLLAAGIPTIDCLETIARIMRNIHFVNALMKTRDEVMKGIPMSEPLETSGVFPPIVYHMTRIGEETGNLEEMLEKLADYYDEEVEQTTQAVLAAMEPLIIVFMSLLIGSLVIAVVLPIGKLYDGLDNL